MTTDPFTTAARAESELLAPTPEDGERFHVWNTRDMRDHAEEMAEWARDHLAEQEPTDAEVEAAGEGIWNRYGDRGMWNHAPEHLRATFRADARAALSAARAARRDEEKR